MRKNFLKIIIILLTIVCISLAGVLVYVKASNNIKDSENNELMAKVMDEMTYIDANVIDAMNKLNNISVARYKVYTKVINENVNNESSEENSNSSSNPKDTGSANGSANSNASGNDASSSGGGENNTGEQTQSSGQGNQSQQGQQNSSQNNINVSQSVVVNSLTETDSTQINWDSISYIYENLYSTWPSIQIDLKELGISNEYLDNFNIDLNGVAQSILAKDKNSCLINFYNLYSQIQNYVPLATTNSNIINLYNTKTALLNAYTLSVGNDKWNEMSSSVKAARDNYFINIVNSNQDASKADNLNKIFAMLENFDSAVALNNKNIFYMHYKNVMQELETLEI